MQAGRPGRRVADVPFHTRITTAAIELIFRATRRVKTRTAIRRGLQRGTGRWVNKAGTQVPHNDQSASAKGPDAQLLFVTRPSSRMNTRHGVSWQTRRSQTNRWRLWLTILVFTILVDLNVCVTSLGDGDKMFRLARCRVRCLASLQVSSKSNLTSVRIQLQLNSVNTRWVMQWRNWPMPIPSRPMSKWLIKL